MNTSYIQYLMLDSVACVVELWVMKGVLSKVMQVIYNALNVKTALITKSLSTHVLSYSVICWFSNLPCERWFDASGLLQAKSVSIYRPSSSGRSLLIGVGLEPHFILPQQLLDGAPQQLLDGANHVLPIRWCKHEWLPVIDGFFSRLPLQVIEEVLYNSLFINLST